jgi:hypothetical protein
MRPTQKPNRPRGRGSRKPGTGGGTNLNRVFDSSGPEGKVRGTPQQIYDKYLTLARDAQTAGDRVTAENFLQHAEHYQRLLSEGQPDRRDQYDQDGEGDEGGDYDSRVQPREGQQREAQQREGQQREGQQRNGQRDGQQRDGQSGREAGNRDTQGRDGEGREDTRGDRNRDDRGRDGGNRDRAARDGDGRDDREARAPRDGDRRDDGYTRAPRRSSAA